MGVSEACYIPAALALIADYHRGPTCSLANGIHHLTDTELREQEAAIRAALRFDTKRGRPYLARYELETFVY